MMRRLNSISIINKIKKYAFLKAVSVLVGGTILGQLINVAISPILSRLYSPADFGVFAAFNSLLLIGVSFSSGGYHLALPLAKDKETARSLVILGGILQLFIFIMLSVFVFSSLKDIFCEMVGLNVLAPYLKLLPIGVFFAGFFELLYYWGLSQKKFLEMSKAKIIKSFYNAIGSILLGWLNFRPWGLLWGQMFNYGGGWFSLLSSLLKEGSIRIGLGIVWKTAVRYKRFPLFSLWSTVLNSLSNQFMPLVFIAFWGEQMAGWFAFSMMVLQLPISLVGQAIGHVFFQRTSESLNKKTENHIGEITLRTLKTLIVMGTIPLLGIGIIAPELFAFIWGEKWHMAGVYSSLLSPYILLVFCFSPISTLLYALELQDKDFFLGSVLFSSRFVSIILAARFSGNMAPIILYSVLSFCAYAFLLCWLLKISGNSWVRAGAFFIKEILIALALGSPVIALRYGGYLVSFKFLLGCICWGASIYGARMYFYIRGKKEY
jgi:O-antigen/teichoic acid export membrane protein